MHILLVEDETRLATAVRRVLEEEGHVADCVEDGADAFVQAQTEDYALLDTRMCHPGQVMTRSQLLDSVWSYDVLTESNVVDIYIHYLRNKIENGFDEKLIRTVRGVGYAIRTG